MLSFALAGLAAAATALCYAELAAMMPVAGSTYSYAFVAFGLLPAWIIGWDLLIEYLFAAATVAVGWSGYAVSLLGSAGVHVPHALAASPFGAHGGIVNLPAVLVVAACTALLVRRDARVGTGERRDRGAQARRAAAGHRRRRVPRAHRRLVAVRARQHGGFGEFGATGVLRGAGVLFFAYVGFDAVSTAAAEARDPRRTVPRALLGTVAVATLLYIGIGLVLTGLVPYRALDVADPISRALAAAGGLGWLERPGRHDRRRRPVRHGAGHALRPGPHPHAHGRRRPAPAGVRADRSAPADARRDDAAVRRRRGRGRRARADRRARRPRLDRDAARLRARLHAACWSCGARSRTPSGRCACRTSASSPRSGSRARSA